MTATSNSGGRNRKSAAAHRLSGTFRPDRHNGVELKTPEGEPPKPESLSGAASSEWDRVIDLLKASRTLTESDGPCVAHYCELYGLADRLQRELDAMPTLVYSRSTQGGESFEPAVHPAVSQLTRIRTAARLYLSELGLTPSSRDRVPKRAAEDDMRAAKRLRFFGRP